ncbi:MAG: ABC transporter substrate-binding protein [Chloroflexi bacterium]|nr:ABC transporter substrate-binding protein [Chloroflexota bacterium]
MGRSLSISASMTLLASVVILGCGPATAPATPSAKPPPATKAAAASPAAASPATVAPSPSPKPAEEGPRYGGILTRGNRHLIPHFDMHQETSSGIQVPLAPFYSTLIQNDPSGEDKLTGDLATGWEVSSDGLTYNFRIREGVKFHDGKPLTSQDVKFNIDRIVFPPKGNISPRQELYQSVDKIEAPSPTTVKITLKASQASFLQLLALPFNFIFSADVIKEKGSMKADIVGSGPFKLANYARDVSLKAVKNPDYFIKGRPYLDGITTYVIVDEMARFAALRTKQLHMLPLTAGPSRTQADELQKAEPRLVIRDRVTPNMTSLTPNTRSAPWNDARVRQAVNLAMDREAAAKVVRAGSFKPGYGYTLPGSFWALSDAELMDLPGFRKNKEQDIAEAKKLLSEAGFPQGLKMTIMTSTTVHARETAEFSKDQLAKVGITADIQVLETGAARSKLFAGTFDLVVWADGIGHEDPDVLLGGFYLSGSGMNYGAWSNGRFDEMYASQSKTLDAARRREIVWEMQRLLHRESPKIVVTWSSYRAVWWDEMKDWNPGRSLFANHKFQDVWLSK